MVDMVLPATTGIMVEVLAVVVEPTEVNAEFADQLGAALVQVGVTGSVPFR